MRKELRRELADDGIEPDKLTDKEVVKKVSGWLFKRAKYLDKMFDTFYVGFGRGRPVVLPGLEKAFERRKAIQSGRFGRSSSTNCSVRKCSPTRPTAHALRPQSTQTRVCGPSAFQHASFSVFRWPMHPILPRSR